MNQYNMVVLIVLIVMVANVFKVRHKAHQGRSGGLDEAEALRMKEDMKMLRDRVAVLERIATDREHSLARQIEELREK